MSRTRSFVEEGDDSVVSGKCKSTNVISGTRGARISSTFGNDSDTAVKVSGMLGWNHRFGDVKPVTSLRYRGSDAPTIQEIPIARSAVVGQPGMQATKFKTYFVDNHRQVCSNNNCDRVFCSPGSVCQAIKSGYYL
ncbi:autotransporter domain-containing protein [Advenella sp. S44]|uniref:autotransporter domain-containing protein n=1 Tax=Advenella sp. S44 TaxID=1982755 RepID=UPI0012900FC5